MGRTKKNIKLKNPEKPRKIKGSQSRRYRTATAISSQPRYDLFDTAADAAAGAPGEKPAVALAEPILTQCFLFRKEFSSILWVA